ncbi:hypothetical protein CROQUDRAFT_652562 [Cronartium quercuum f. sp. fusiforme G11]|uniref:Uncharacterized protein n=1 Tax=Cronartium quercuum f. sp. fusiforme G11 TaxID=708437 RepID=A0A9P6NTW5_9BASI|nr:hypothetical protein CROQUDRAFT_652562 [Cronartium quercuum f. sp. fusiforme G11]
MTQPTPRCIGANLVDIEGNEFDTDGPLLDNIFTSEGMLTDVWKEDSGMVDSANTPGGRD